MSKYSLVAENSTVSLSIKITPFRALCNRNIVLKPLLVLCPANKLQNITQGSRYFFHDKMPGCCLPSLTAATASHFTAGHLKG
jgi:hypothetical protein